MTDPIASLTAALVDRYRIERELGQGGMATVYLGQDVKHDRKVALKVLRPELAAVIGAERFLAEIKTTANLQHPHILPLYDSGRAGGQAAEFLFYVMPFIEGETVRDRLNREKQLPVADAVRIAGEVASALDYAHRQGVIHRDIKPENILLHDGSALVADFGIALAVSSAGGTRMTETGMSLGTPHYMSPEQAMGDRDVDARSDVYALGATLYEMLAGEPPFTGPTAQAIVAKVVTAIPEPVTTYRKTTPPHVADAVDQALHKLPADRFARATDFAAALANPNFVSSTRAAARQRSPSHQRALAGLGTLALVASGLAVWGWVRRPPTVPEEAVRFIVPLAADEGLPETVFGPRVAISRDGRTLAFVGTSPVERQLYIRELNEAEPRALLGTEGAYEPAFSPDGRWIAFATTDKIEKIDLATNRVATLAPLPRAGVLASGMAWGDDDTLLVIQGRQLLRVPGGGGTPRDLSLADTAPAGHAQPLFFWPDILPGGEVAIVNANDDGPKLERLSLRSGKRTVLLEGNYVARYAPPGHLLIQSGDQAVSVVPFAVRQGRITESPVPLLPSVARGVGGSGDFDVSATGVLVFVAAGAPRRTVVLVDRRGQETTLIARPAAYEDPKVSPDGPLLAYAEESEGRRDIWLYDLARTTSARLTFESDNFYPTWSPDGKRVAFASRRSGPSDIYSLPADGSGRLDTLYQSGLLSFPGAFTPDGRTLLFRQTHASSGFNILARDFADSGSNARTVLQTPFNETAPALSPDGRWLAYASDETGRNEVYLRRYPSGEGRWSVSIDGGSEPVWRRDGGELFFRNGTGLYAVTIGSAGGAAPRIGHVVLLFQGPYRRNGRWAEYDVMPDGNHFVMVRNDATSLQLQVATRWTDVLAPPADAEGR
jgi:eukaryotic-like serine/threonine-protein kinase